jgi:hypothetical protein
VRTTSFPLVSYIELARYAISRLEAATRQAAGGREIGRAGLHLHQVDRFPEGVDGSSSESARPAEVVRAWGR